MVFAKTATGLILWSLTAGLAAAAEPYASFQVRHEHLRKGCDGQMAVDENGIRFASSKGKHSWAWAYTDIQELRLEPSKIHILTYKDNKFALGADRDYDFTGKIPAEELYAYWKTRMDQRFVAALPELPSDDVAIPVKHLRRISGSEGTLAFGADTVVYSTTAAGESRTWRYTDIDSISSSGPFQLTITTYERAKSHYGERKGFNFELKQPLSEATYNQLWLDMEKKNGRIQ